MQRFVHPTYGELRAENERLKQDRDDADRDVETLQAVLKRQDTEVEQLNQARDMIAEEREAWKASAQQSRATEAELRARVTDLVRAIRTEHQTSNGSSVYMEGPLQHERSIMRCRHPLCAALDTAEQPARAEQGQG